MTFTAIQRKYFTLNGEVLQIVHIRKCNDMEAYKGVTNGKLKVTEI